MKIFVLRHAKTQVESSTGRDFDRDLKPKGYRQLEMMNEYFQSQFENVNFTVFCSDAVRTKSTFEKLKPAIHSEEEYFHHELYLPSLNGLLSFLWSQPTKSGNVLLIGHNNGLSELCSYLSGAEVWLPTCGLIVYDFPNFDSINEVSRETGIEKHRFFPKP